MEIVVVVEPTAIVDGFLVAGSRDIQGEAPPVDQVVGAVVTCLVKATGETFPGIVNGTRPRPRDPAGYFLLIERT